MEKTVQSSPSPPPLSPAVDAVELSDILDAKALQSMMDAFFALENIGMAIADRHGRILVATGWQDVCTKFHRVHPETCRHCRESDVVLSAGIAPGEFKLYRCQNNLWDMATPIVVGGRHVGNFFLGQFFFDDEQPDADLFRAQARRYGFDEADYLAALDRVPRWSREKIDRAMTFYARLSAQISEMGYRNLQLTQALANQKRAEEALRDSKQIIEGVIRAIPARVFWKDRNLVFLGCNEMFARDAGFASPQEVVGKDDFQMAWREQADLYRADDRQVIESGRAKLLIEEPQTTPDGRTLALLTSKMPLRNAKGEIIGVLGTYLDVTDRKRAERDLQESEEQYRLLVENAQEAVYVVRDGRVVFANAMFARLADMDTSAVIGTSTEQFVAPEDRAGVQDHYRRLIAGETPESPFEVRVRTRKGAERWVSINAARILWKGQPATLNIAADITARRRTEERLRLHAQLLDSVSESVVASDLEGRILYWGRGAEKLYGYKADEVLGQPYRNFAGASEPPDEEAFRKELLARGSWQGEHVQKNRAGKAFWTSTVISLVRDELGRPTGYIGIDQDVTERKQAEEALRASDERFRQVAETAKEWIWEMDADGVYTYSNPVVEDILGYAPEELVGKIRFHELFAPDVREEIRKDAAERSARKEAFRKRVNPVVHKDGHLVVLETTGVPILGPDGHLAGYRGADTDVTERKRAEEARQESEALYRSILNASPDDITLADLEGQILMVSPSALKMFGYERIDQMLGRRVFEFIVPEDRERAAADVARLHQGVTSGPVGYRSEYRGLRADGTTFDVEVNGEFIRNAAGHPVRMILIARDVTERKRTEERLRDRERQFELLFESMSFGFALHEIILDAAGTPCDYRFLRVNPAFEVHTGLKADALIGRTVLEVLPRTESSWIERYGRVALTGEPVTFESYSGELDRHYQVTAYRPQPGQFAVLVSDITALKRAQNDLQSKQAMLARTETLALVGSWEWDVATDTVIWSDELFRIFRRDPAQGAPTFAEHPALFPPEDFRRLNEAVAAALRDGTPYELELRTLCRDGVTRTCLAHGQAERKDGRVVRLSGSFQDITDRKRAEEAIRQSEEKFAQAFHISPYAITLTRATDGQFIDVNAAFAAITGYSREEALADSSIGLGLWARPEDRQQVVDDLRNGNPVIGREYAFRAKSGHRIIGLFSAQILRMGNDSCILSSINDISDRKRAEDALRESEQRHRDYLAHSPYGIFVADERGRFVQVNPAACRITGFSEKELLSKSVPDLHGEDGREDAVRHFQAVLREGKAVGELKFRTKAGESRWWLVSAVKLSGTRFLGFCNDVTDRKQAEEKLRTSAERFQDIAANIPGVVFQLQSGRTGSLEVPYMSSGCEALFGRPLRNLDFTGLLFDQMHLGDRALFLHSVDSAARKMEPWSLEFRILVPEGPAKWLRGSANPRQTPQGGVLWNGVLLDITGLKQAEQSLREREAFQTLLMDTIPSPVFYKDRQGRYLGFNKAFETLYGKTKEQLVGKSIFDIASPELAAICHAKDLELLERPGTQIYEAPMRDSEGGLHSIMFHKASIVDAHGSVAGLIGILLDVTERKRAEEKILQESLLNKTIIGSIPGTFYMLDEAGHYLRWSQYQQEQIVGQSDELMRETTALATIHPDDRDLIRARIENVLKNGVDEVVEGRVLLRGGPDFRWLLMTGRRLVVEGRPALIGIGIDITERKQAEAQVAQQLEELRRWQTVTLGREGRVAELKREVNALAVRLGQSPPYSRAEAT